MVRIELGRLVVGIGALVSASGALAQDNVVVGDPRLRDFSLPVQERIVTQPAPPPVQVAPPSPVNTPSRVTPPPPSTRPVPTQAAPQTQRSPAPQQAPVQATPSPLAPTIQPPPTALPPASETAPAPSAPPVSIPADARPQPEGGGFPWLYVLPLALVALAGFALLRRRRRDSAFDEVVYEAAEAPAPVAPPEPRRDPVERPWLELELRANRASFTAAEANLNFELEIRNSGKTPAKNLRIDVKLFNAGVEQDKEIGTFFRTAGRETTRLTLPGVPAGASGMINGEVGMPLEQMRAVQLDGRQLFIPVIAVNALYDCGDGRTGQSSKSYVVGRELQEASEKMGAFRVDQGPRIWRTVGQRPHKLTRRI